MWNEEGRRGMSPVDVCGMNLVVLEQVREKWRCRMTKCGISKKRVK